MNEPEMQENSPLPESPKVNRTMITIVVIVAIGFALLIALNMN
jgi:hypothetical protein